MNRISIRGTAMTAAAALVGSAAIVGGTAWTDEPEKQAVAYESGIEPRQAAAIAAEERNRNLWQIAKLEGKDQQREEALERARRKALAEKRAREAAERAAAERARRAAAERANRAAREASVPSGSPKEIAMAMLGDYGWSSSEFGCLDALWEKESGWDPSASNPSSGAYGIPQALPGSKMADAGSDWESNPATQIEWGLGYIQDRYGSPCAAWDHSQANGWY